MIGVILLLLFAGVNSQCNFTCEIIDNTTTVTTYADSVIFNDTEIFAYTRNGSDIVYTEYNGTDWISVTLKSYTGALNIKLKLINSIPSILVYDSTVLYLWQRFSGSWNETIILNSTATVIQLSSYLNNPTVAYSSGLLLYYGESNGTDWVFNTITYNTTGGSTIDALVLNGDFMAWQLRTATGPYKIFYGVYNDSSWTSNFLGFNGEDGGYMALENVAGYFPTVAVTDTNTGYAITLYHFNATNSWNEETITQNLINIAPSLHYINGIYPSIAFINNATSQIDIYNHDNDHEWYGNSSFTPPAGYIEPINYYQRTDSIVVTGVSGTTGVFACRKNISCLTLPPATSTTSTTTTTTSMIPIPTFMTVLLVLGIIIIAICLGSLILIPLICILMGSTKLPSRRTKTHRY